MKIFKYNTKTLNFEKVTPGKVYGVIVLILIIVTFIGWLLGSNNYIVNKIIYKNEVTDTLVVHGEKFTEGKLIELLKDCNFKYPYIILAQAKLESGNFTSFLFHKNNNMFGMKKPRKRATTSISEKNGYAYYRDWIDCVYDYGFYSCCNLSDVNSEGEYYKILSERYAEDTSYINKLQNLIQKEKLKKLFED